MVRGLLDTGEEREKENVPVSRLETKSRRELEKKMPKSIKKRENGKEIKKCGKSSRLDRKDRREKRNPKHNENKTRRSKPRRLVCLFGGWELSFQPLPRWLNTLPRWIIRWPTTLTWNTKRLATSYIGGAASTFPEILGAIQSSINAALDCLNDPAVTPGLMITTL